MRSVSETECVQALEEHARAVDADELGVAQIVGEHRIADPLDIVRRGIEAETGVLDFPGDQIRLGGRKIADRDIRLAPLQVARGIRGNDLNIDEGLQPVQLCNDRWQDERRVDLACRYADRAFDRLRPARRRQRHTVGRLSHPAHVFKQVQPARRQLQALADPLEQHQPEFVLQRLHLTAQGRLRQLEGPGGSGQGALLRHGEKRLRLVPVKVHCPPIHP